MTAVVSLLLVHRTLAWGRLRSRLVRRVVDRRPRVLARDGHVDRLEIERALVTDDDLWTVLRQHGVGHPGGT